MQIDLFGVPMDLGAGICGTDQGPRGLREAGIARLLFSLGHDVIDHGDVHVAARAELNVGDPTCRYLDETAAVAERLCRLTRASAAEGRVPVVLGGDHGLALGSIRGAATGRKLGVIWIDAHADFNTRETSPSGNIHGMPLAALAGLGEPRLVGVGGPGSPARAIDPAHIAIVGTRDVDAGERLLLERERVQVFTSESVRKLGVAEIIARAIAVASRGTDGIYLSIDLDAFDPAFAPGVSTPVSGGLTPEQGIIACRAVAATGLLAGIDLVELNPVTDLHGATARLALALIGAAMGGELGRPESRPTPCVDTVI